ncbi:MAG: lysine biosynthesis protein LysW [Planctomycetota bacterium]|nr:MAG: lysine biosynthesis protein LysW [Planctomycetota bacterium]
MSNQCVECGCQISVPKDIEMGEILDCPNCGVELEIKGTQPLVLMVFEEEEK